MPHHNHTSTKKSLIIFSQGPYRSEASKESLDFALGLAAFEQNITLMLVNEGIWNLVTHQAPTHAKPFTQLFKGLALYDIHHIVVPKSTLVFYQIHEDSLITSVDVLNDDHLSSFLQQFHQVYSF